MPVLLELWETYAKDLNGRSMQAVVEEHFGVRLPELNPQQGLNVIMSFLLVYLVKQKPHLDAMKADNEELHLKIAKLTAKLEVLEKQVYGKEPA